MAHSDMWASRRGWALWAWHPRLWVAVIIAALACPATYAQPGSSSAPWAGAETYTVHAKGSLDDVLAAIRATTGATITKGFSQPALPGEVTLDLADAPLRDILLEVCRQTGLVYDVAPGARRVVLRTGDVAADPRPMVDVGDYIIHVDEVVSQRRETVTLRWGQAEPTRSELGELRVRLSVVPAAGELCDLLAGVSSTVTAVTDSGETLSSPAAPGGAARADRQATNIGTTLSAVITLGAPATPATVLASLEGALMRYSEAKTTEIALHPGDVGKAINRDDVTAEVKTWSHINGTLKVSVVLKYLPLGGAADGMDSASATLVLKDGTVRSDAGSTLRGSAADAGAEITWQYQFDTAAAPEIDHLTVMVTRRGPADQSVPFRIEGIPLP